METFLILLGVLIGILLVAAQYMRFNVRVVQLERREEDDDEDVEEEEPFFTEGEVAQLTAPHEEGSFLKPLILFVLVMLGAFAYTICHAQTAPVNEATELQRLREELESERAARKQAEADVVEALAIAREAAARLEEADATFAAPFLAGAPTQRVPSSQAVVYVDQLPPGVAIEDTIRFTSDDGRGWLVIMLGNELPSLPLNGQQPFPMNVDLDGIRTTMFVVPPGSTGYVVPDRSSYEVIRLVRFEGSALSASGLRFAGVKFVRDYHARHPHGRLFTDSGFNRTGGEVDAVKAVLLQSAPLVAGR